MQGCGRLRLPAEILQNAPGIGTVKMRREGVDAAKRHRDGGGIAIAAAAFVSAVGGYIRAQYLNTVLKIGEQAESACSFQICGSLAATGLDRFAAGWYNKCNIVCVFYIRTVDF